MEEEGPDPPIVIGSLRALIERLRDPDGDSFLRLTMSEQLSIGEYEGVDDFAEIFSEYLDAIKANTTITEIEIKGFQGAEKGSIFPIVNPLLRHLPRRKSLKFEVARSASVQRFLYKDAARFTAVKIVNWGPSDDEAVLELHPDLQVFEYTNRQWGCANTVIGPILLSLTFPSQLREFRVIENLRFGNNWDDERIRPFTEPEFTRLVDIVQVSSLVKLSLELLRFSSIEECSRFACGLLASPVKDLCLALFTPDASNYNAIVSALSKMQHLKSLEAIFELDEWHGDAETVGSFSIPAGDIVRGAPGMKSLKMVQGWKPWDEVQCRDLAMAIQAPSCGLQHLDIGLCRTPVAAATVMSTFSSPSSSVEEFRIYLETSGDADLLVSRLPRRTNLRRLDIRFYEDSPPAITELQQEMFLSIVSGWYHLTDMNTFQQDGFKYCCLSKDFREKIETLLRLNNAGRHYLTSPTPSKADGVEVLIKVRAELNDIYTHLLENPCLCDRGVATPSAGRTPSPIPKKPRHS